jgi:hypothetical protein
LRSAVHGYRVVVVVKHNVSKRKYILNKKRCIRAMLGRINFEKRSSAMPSAISQTSGLFGKVCCRPNEGLVQPANERPVCCAGGIWITRAVGRVRTGECLWNIGLLHAKCGGLENYPSSLHWIGKSTYEL